jgi:hypothetical protein
LLDLRAGQLELFAGVGAGEFRTAAGTVLWFWGRTHTLGPGTSFTGSGAVRLAQGAAPAKWLVNDALTIPQLELGENGTLDASGLAAGNLIQITNLVSHDDAVLRNGEFQVQSFQMLDQSLLDHVTIAVAGSLTAAGTNCTLQSSTLNNFGAYRYRGNLWFWPRARSLIILPGPRSSCRPTPRWSWLPRTDLRILTTPEVFSILWEMGPTTSARISTTSWPHRGSQW